MASNERVRRVAIFLSALGTIVGIAVFFNWLTSGINWHPEQHFLQKMTHPSVIALVVWWTVSAIGLFAVGLVVSRNGFRWHSAFLAAITWIAISYLLANFTSYTSVNCFSPLGSIGCLPHNLRLKLEVMLISLGFSFVLGMAIDNAKLQKLVSRYLKSALRQVAANRTAN